MPDKDYILQNMSRGPRIAKVSSWRWIICLLLLISPVLRIQAQVKVSPRIDSLTKALNQETNPLKKTDLLNQLGFEFGTIEKGKATRFLRAAQLLASQNNYKKGVGDALSNLSMVNELHGDHFTSLSMQIEALKIREEIGDSIGISNSIHYIGDVYSTEAEISTQPAAQQELNKQALEHFIRSVQIAKKIGDEDSEANGYNCMGNAFRLQQDMDSAIHYYHKAVALRKKQHNEKRLAQTYGQMGKFFLDGKQLDSSRFYLDESLRLGLKTNYTRTNIKTLCSLGQLYVALKQYDKAIDYCKQSLELSTRVGFLEWIVKARKVLYSIYANKDYAGYNPALALQYMSEYLQARDSINARNLEQAEMQYHLEQQKAVEKMEQEKKDLQVQNDRRRQNLITMGILSTLLLVSLFALFIFRALRERNKQNKTISEQKKLVEEKQQEIVSSIQYALRIQTAILPPRRLIQEALPTAFVLYLPKDIVAGDFYWMASTEQGLLIAACDCTGHGVPGAMVSVVCSNAMSKAVHEFGLRSPAAILEKTAEIVRQNFALSEEHIRDGMDVSLCLLDRQTGELRWAGANNPLWLLREGDITEIKAVKRPVGMTESEVPFAEHLVQLRRGDRIYLFSDGFPDQFGGGASGKKLTKKRFRELLLSSRNTPILQQGEELRQFILNYRGSTEQTDDILVIGYEW